MTDVALNGQHHAVDIPSHAICRRMRGAGRIKPDSIPKKDREHSEPLSASQPDKINVSQTKTALHRTRLRVLDHKNFSVLFFYKPDRQSAPVLAVCRKTKTEKIEMNFSVFQF